MILDTGVTIKQQTSRLKRNLSTVLPGFIISTIGRGCRIDDVFSLFSLKHTVADLKTGPRVIIDNIILIKLA